MSHTKGPWLCPSASAAKYGFPRWKIGFENDGCLGSVAVVLPVENEDGICSKETRQANAHLITAAPDMLELLERIRYAGVIGNPLLHEEVREVIAAAKGETQ